MFDTSAEIELGMNLQSGAKSVVVRWPTDEEWAARSRNRKFVIHRLGRGISETIPPKPSEHDLALYRRIALNGAPDLTMGEAFQVAESIATCSVTNVEVEGDNVTVDMNILTGPVQHKIKMPTMDAMVTFKTAGFKILDLPFNQQQLTLLIEPGAKLWDQCQGSSTDYTGAVPAIHKDAAMRAIQDVVDRNLGPRHGDQSF